MTMVQRWTFKKSPYWTCQKLFTLIENYVMDRSRLPSRELQDCYLKNIFPNKLSLLISFSDFISDMGVTDHRHYDQ